MLAHAFANRAIWDGNYPIVSTMRAYELGYLALVIRRWDDASIHPVLGSLEWYI